MGNVRANEEKGNWFFENIESLKERRPDKKKLLNDIFADLYGDTDNNSKNGLAD